MEENNKDQHKYFYLGKTIAIVSIVALAGILTWHFSDPNYLWIIALVLFF